MSHRHETPKPRRTINFNPALVQILVKIGRDVAIFILGGYAFMHELVRSGSERPQILIMSAAMMGLPLIMRGDEKKQEVKTNADKSNPDAWPNS